MVQHDTTQNSSSTSQNILYSLVVGVSSDVVEHGARRSPVLVGKRFVHTLLRVISSRHSVTPAQPKSKTALQTWWYENGASQRNIAAGDGIIEA